MRKPTAEEARFMAACLEACVPGELAVAAVDPEVPEEQLAEVARRWERDRQVRAARFDVRAWLERTPEDRLRSALERTRNGMAVFLATHNVAELTDTKLTKALKFMEALEKVVAGTAGKSDPSADFFAKVLKGEIKLGSPVKRTEAVN